MKSLVFFTRHVPLSMAARAQQSSIQPAYSLDSDTEIISNALATLLRSGGGRWSLTPTGNGLQRTFKFKSFKKTWVRHLVMALIRVQISFCRIS
jgi:4a-hydroxytetrahydrobiopterin dehydratase